MKSWFSKSIRVSEGDNSSSLMPKFNSEEEFNKFFARENSITAPYRNADGELVFGSEAEAIDIVSSLLDLRSDKK